MKRDDFLLSTVAKQPRYFIDLFAGCGGLSLGLIRAGWTGVFAVERDKFAFATYKANLIDGKGCRQVEWPSWVSPEAISISAFLKRLREDKRLLKHLQGIELVAGAPPCQGFSFAGKRRHDDPRNALFRDYLAVISMLRPRMLLMENVGGIAVRHGGNKMPFAEKISKGLTKLGYETVSGIHRASEFGVPQERPRYVVVGVDRGRFRGLIKGNLVESVEDAIRKARIKSLKAKGIDPAILVPVKAALSDLEIEGGRLEDCPDAPRRLQLKYREPRTLTAYQSCLRAGAPARMDSMRLAMHSPDVRKKFGALIKECKVSNRRGVTLNPEERKILKTKKRNVVVLDPLKPSHTLTTLPDDLVHYDEPRILTVREYARLQSFPDWFVFRGKYTTGGDMRKKECPRYTQVGNAVAPFVAEVLGLAFLALSQKGKVSAK